MAYTYTVGQVGITFASGKNMLSIYNGSGSGRIVKVYRIWALNNQTVAITGVLTTFEIRRTTSQSGGTALTPVKHDTSNPDVPPQIVCATGATVTLTDLFRRILWSNDEPAVGTGTMDELECFPTISCIWDSGYADANVQPITLREGEGLTVYHSGSTTVGNVDMFMEFTIE